VRETLHRQADVRADGQHARVDEGIAPLIREIWRLGIETIFSCQGGPAHSGGPVPEGFLEDDPRAVVTFDGPEAEAFLNVIFSSPGRTDDLDVRMRGPGVYVSDEHVVRIERNDPRAWSYDASPQPASRGGASSVREAQRDMILLVHVRFPPDDIPILTELFAAARKQVRTD